MFRAVKKGLHADARSVARATHPGCVCDSFCRAMSHSMLTNGALCHLIQSLTHPRDAQAIPATASIQPRCIRSGTIASSRPALPAATRTKME